MESDWSGRVGAPPSSSAFTLSTQAALLSLSDQQAPRVDNDVELPPIAQPGGGTSIPNTNTNINTPDSTAGDDRDRGPRTKGEDDAPCTPKDTGTGTGSVVYSDTDPKGKVKVKRQWYHPLRIVGWAVDNWFLLGIGVAIVLAWRFPHVAAEGGVLRSQYSISYGLIALIFLITGLTLSTPALIHQASNWRLHLFTQVTSFFLFPTVVFAITNIVRAAQGLEGSIDKYVLAGMVVMGCMPTTVASNIAMTRAAGGNVEGATVEVCIGNLIGAFLTPLLCKLFFSSSTWAFAQPAAAGGSTSSSQGLRAIYKQLAKQLGLALFLPLFVGQVVQNLFPRQTKIVATTLRLPKVATFCLLLIIWSVFSTQFEERAFESLSAPSIVFTIFVNLALYGSFTLLCVFFSRLPFLSSSFDLSNLDHDGHTPPNAPEGKIAQQPQPQPRLSIRPPPLWRRILSQARFTKKEATAICFCAAAKGLVVGSPVLNVLYGGFEARDKAVLSIPLVLYQGQQVAIAQVLVYFFKRWNARPDRLAEIRRRPHGPSGVDEKRAKGSVGSEEGENAA